MWVAMSCSLFDPTQDTEREQAVLGSKVGDNVAAYSIRHRILKESSSLVIVLVVIGCSLFDPTQDTERLGRITMAASRHDVAAYSIRHRILKGLEVAPVHDPRISLQPIRSDTGY